MNMKKLVLTVMTCSLFLSIGYSSEVALVKKEKRSPSNAAIKISGAKAENLFRATLAADESLADSCTAHTCSFTTKCSYDQTSSEKYVCTVVP
jgi:hypothetical protein